MLCSSLLKLRSRLALSVKLMTRIENDPILSLQVLVVEAKEETLRGFRFSSLIVGDHMRR